MVIKLRTMISMRKLPGVWFAAQRSSGMHSGGQLAADARLE